MPKNYTGGLTLTNFPVAGDTNWAANVDGAMEDISAHDHDESAGRGKQIGANGIASNAVNDTKIRLRNNQSLRARNAADSADVDLLQLDSNNVLEIERVARLSSTETLTGSGAISVATSLTLINSASATTMTLAAGSEGQIKLVANIGAGTSTITSIGSVPASGGCLVLVYVGTGWKAVRSLKGTTTNDDAQTGEVGEVLRTTRLRSAATALATGTAANIASPTSITLTPGDWDVRGAVVFLPAGATNVTQINAAVSKTSATMPALDTIGAPTAGEYWQAWNQAASVPSAEQSLAIPSFRASVSTNTPIFLVGRAAFTVSTMTAYGFLEARRVR